MSQVRTALVTGGGAGIGAAIARELQGAGHQCVITGRAKNRPDTLDADIGYLQLDYLDAASLGRATETILENLKPDILINNAGINRKGAMVDIPASDMLDAITTNLTGPYQITQSCLPHMLRQNWGRIVNITSIWSVTGNPGNTAYCASKFGVDGMTVALAAEVGHRGVLVNAVAPGYIMTDALRAKYTPEMLERIATHVPIARPGQPEEVAALVGWLASPDNGYVTGQNIRIDGGLTRTAQPFTRID